MTNDTLAPLRTLRQSSQSRKSTAGKPARRGTRGFRSRRAAKSSGSEGRWSLFTDLLSNQVTVTERQSAIAAQLIDRYGVVTREIVANENIAGGFSSIYPILKAMRNLLLKILGKTRINNLEQPV